MPDDHFPDLMRQAGMDDPEVVESWSDAVVGLATNASADRAARIVEIAHGHVIDRDSDRWFWEPFRNVHGTFPIEDGIEIHSRLADATVRHRLAQAEHLDAMLVRLAELAGMTPCTDLLREAASEALVGAARPAAPPTVRPLQKPWTQDKTKANEASAAPDLEDLTSVVQGLGNAVNSSLVALRNDLDKVAEWSRSTERRLSREVGMSHWLINGLRSDGTAWEELDIVTLAVDASLELSEQMAGDVPMPRHEAMLRLVLDSARNGADESCSGPSAHTTVLPDVPERLTPFAPVLTALSVAKSVPIDSTAAELAVRVLWEACTAAAWPTS